MCESTAKYIIPIVGGPWDGATYYVADPLAVVYLPPPCLAPVTKVNAGGVAGPAGPPYYPYKYLLQPSPARYIYEHLAHPQKL